MKEAKRNLWGEGGPAPDAICITTNGTVKSNGSCVMGRGCAMEATYIYTGIAHAVGYQIRMRGLGVYVIPVVAHPPVVAFPVKHEWHEKADLALIERSAEQLMDLIQGSGWTDVLLPRPGCGNGQRDWETEVRPIVEKILDDRVTVVYK